MRTHGHCYAQVAGPAGRFIHNLALLLLLSSSALFRPDCVRKSQTWWLLLHAKLWSAAECKQTYAFKCVVTHTHTYTCPHKCRWLTFSCLAVLPSPGDGPANNYKKQTCLWLTRSCISLFVVHCFSTLPLFTLKSSMSFSFSSTASFSLFTSAFSVSLASWRHLTKAERRVKQRNINREEE